MNANEREWAANFRKIHWMCDCGQQRTGAGFLEAVYAAALAVELVRQDVRFEREKRLQVFYRSVDVGTQHADFLVEGCLLLELKALRALTTEHAAQVMHYLRASGIAAGLLLNFGTAWIGVKRIVLRHDDSNPI
jgi:GxxExxY protein